MCPDYPINKSSMAHLFLSALVILACHAFQFHTECTSDELLPIPCAYGYRPNEDYSTKSPSRSNNLVLSHARSFIQHIFYSFILIFLLEPTNSKRPFLLPISRISFARIVIFRFASRMITLPLPFISPIPTTEFPSQ